MRRVNPMQFNQSVFVEQTKKRRRVPGTIMIQEPFNSDLELSNRFCITPRFDR